MSRTGRCPLEATLQILRISNGQLIDATADDDQTGNHFAETENVIDANVQFDTAQINVRYNACMEFFDL